MPNFRYKAISLSGAKVSGIVEAYDEFEAVDQIKLTCRVVTAIHEVDEKNVSILQMNIGPVKIKEDRLALMCSQFAIVLKAGMPIVRAVELIATQTEDPLLRNLLEKVSEDVATGYGLAQSFENKGAKLLPTSFIETVRSGEESGTLEISFDKLNKYFDRSFKLKRKVKSAMTQPTFLAVMAVVVIAIVMVVAMPVFLEMFSEAGIDLPAPTRMLIAISDFFASSWVLILVFIIGVIIAVRVIGKTENGMLAFAKLKLRLPILGHLNAMTGASQFANTMSTMLSSGLTIVRAVAICAKVVDNYYISTQLAAAVTGIEEGKPLGQCLRKCDCFPELLIEMTAVGDETGSLETTLNTIGEYYDSEVEIGSERALNALQPIITIVMGVVIGFIVIALYLPMFGMGSAIG